VVAFSRSADALLVVRRDHAAIVELDSPSVRARVPLDGLAALLAR
jgi:hypothetical protein